MSKRLIIPNVVTPRFLGSSVSKAAPISEDGQDAGELEFGVFGNDEFSLPQELSENEPREDFTKNQSHHVIENSTPDVGYIMEDIMR